jgi:hypothetical protein
MNSLKITAMHFRNKKHPRDRLSYTILTKERLFEDLKSFKQKVYQDCFENFYFLIIEGHLETD